MARSRKINRRRLRRGQDTGPQQGQYALAAPSIVDDEVVVRGALVGRSPSGAPVAVMSMTTLGMDGVQRTDLTGVVVTADGDPQSLEFVTFAGLDIIIKLSESAIPADWQILVEANAPAFALPNGLQVGPFVGDVTL